MASPPKSKTDLKLIVLGSANIGKTTLLQRYLTGNFTDTISSIGASLALKKWEDWTVALWDTAGEERYASLSAFYCRGASVAVLAFDLTNSTSFNKLREIFIPLLQDSVDNCLTVVVGTKVDLLETDGRQVRTSEGVELAVQQHEFQLQRALKHDTNTYLKSLDGSKLYYETSSKTGANVDELFADVQRMLLATFEKVSGTTSKKPAKGVVQLGEGALASNTASKPCCGAS